MTTPTPHRCDNCDGIDPASCINAPTLRHQLVRLRQDHGISQAELAQRIGVTQTAVSYWETGQRQPGLDDVERWADALGASPSLLQGSPTAGSNEPGDLRERLRGVIRESHRSLVRTGRLAADVVTDAVLPIVEAAIAEKDSEVAATKIEWLGERRVAGEWRHRAEEAERRRDQAENRADLYREQVRTEHERAGEAEAALAEQAQTLRAVEIDRDQWRDRAHHWQATAGPSEHSDEYDLDTDPDALRRNLNEVITALDGRGPKMTHDAVWARVRPVLRIHREKLAEQRQRAEEAEAALAEVRRLQDMTIASSIRVQAIHQAEDTLAILNRHTKEADSA